MFNIVRLTGLAVAALVLAACSSMEKSASESALERAERLARNSIIVDTHVDVPYRRHRDPVDISRRVQAGDFDYPRAVAGGLNAPFMSIYTAASLEAEGGSKELAEQLIDLVESYETRWPGKFAIARSPADVRAHFDKGLISLPMGMENGSPIEGKLSNIKHFYDRGIRYLSLSHSLSNHLSDSSYDEERKWQGLSELGKQAVVEMNRLGIMIDVSHLSDDAFWQVIDLSKAPVIASHSSARHFTPGMERNMSDEMIRALADNGGVIQINFGSYFLTQEAREYGDARWAAGKAYQAEHPDFTDSDLWTKFPAIYAAENGPYPYASLDDLLDHFDHAVKVAGIDHVGIGSDFDGVGDSLPEGVKDVAGYPNLVRGFLERGYSDEDIRKILGENLLRVWQQVEDYAATTSSST